MATLLSVVPELPSTSEEAFRNFAAQSFNRDARDFKVVWSGRECIGLLTSTLLLDTPNPLRHFRIVIHPGHRRNGLGRALLEAVEQQESMPGTVLQCNSQRSWHDANAFLERYGFSVTRTELLMRRQAHKSTTADFQDFTFRNASPNDDDAWIQLHAEAYGKRDDFSALVVEDLETERTSPWFTLVLAEQSGNIVGYCHGLQHEGNEGLVNSLVVRADARGRGLGAALLTRGINSLCTHGAVSVSLNVRSENKAAIALYEKACFRVYDEILTFHRSRG